MIRKSWIVILACCRHLVRPPGLEWDTRLRGLPRGIAPSPDRRAGLPHGRMSLLLRLRLPLVVRRPGPLGRDDPAGEVAMAGAASAGLARLPPASIPTAAGDYIHGLGIGHFTRLSSMVMLAAVGSFGLVVRRPQGATRSGRRIDPRAEGVPRIAGKWPS